MAPAPDLSLSKSHGLLQPWIELANKVGKPVWTQNSGGNPEMQAVTGAVTAEQLYAGLTPAIADAIKLNLVMPDNAYWLYRRLREPSCITEIYQLALYVAGALHYLAEVNERNEFFRAEKYRSVEYRESTAVMGMYVQGAAIPAGFQVRPSGRVHVRMWSPWLYFQEALGLASPGRIRRCPVCLKLFFARRVTALTDTPACNHVRHERRRRWRLAKEKHEGASQGTDPKPDLGRRAGSSK